MPLFTRLLTVKSLSRIINQPKTFILGGTGTLSDQLTIPVFAFDLILSPSFIPFICSPRCQSLFEKADLTIVAFLLALRPIC